MSGLSSWILVSLSAASVSTASVQLTSYAASQPSSTQPARDSWSTYKLRLAILARQQGVREATIQQNVPNLELNQRAIEMERTEPVARSTVVFGREDTVMRQAIRKLRCPPTENSDCARVQRNEATLAGISLAFADSKPVTHEINLLPAQEAEFGVTHAGV